MAVCHGPTLQGKKSHKGRKASLGKRKRVEEKILRRDESAETQATKNEGKREATQIGEAKRAELEK